MSPETLENPRLTAGSLTALMDELVRLAEAINDAQGFDPTEQLSVFRWKPPRPPTRGVGLWHLLTEGPPPEQKDVNRLREHITISAFIGMKHGDQDKDLAQIERYIDAYRDLIDPAIYKPEPRGVGPLNGAARWAERLAMRMTPVTFAGIEFMACEFPLQFDVDRPLTH